MIDHNFLNSLTNAEILVFNHVIRRRRYREIAMSLKISIKTVGYHVNRICFKAGISEGKKNKLIQEWDAALKREKYKFAGY